MVEIGRHEPGSPVTEEQDVPTHLILNDLMGSPVLDDFLFEQRDERGFHPAELAQGITGRWIVAEIVVEGYVPRQALFVPPVEAEIAELSLQERSIRCNGVGFSDLAGDRSHFLLRRQTVDTVACTLCQFHHMAAQGSIQLIPVWRAKRLNLPW